jgi:hypothetical protein
MMTLALCLIVMTAAPEVTAVMAKPPESIAEAIRAELAAEGLVVKVGETALAEFWLRAVLPSGAEADAVKAGLKVTDLAETTLLGVVRFPVAFTDYRKQVVPPGVYTLRFAVQPDIGDHKDTAPHREFAMLSPTAKDRDPDTLDLKDLLKLSRESTAAGDHPAVIMIAPVKAKVEKPTIRALDDSVQLLELTQTVNARGGRTNMAFGITVTGSSKTR